MIRITKPRAPAVLRNRGARETQELKDAYDSDPAAYRSGAKKMDIDDVYRATSVKNGLIKAQADKCCFCESKITHVAYGDVEHFRPKKGWKQNDGDELGRPGYYWLAYDWGNLFLSCQICNQRHKGNLFPLTDANARAESHHDDIAEESPVFVHPSDDQPEDFITFRRYRAIGRDQAGRGAATIDALGLDRATVWRRREERYETLKTIWEAERVFSAMERAGKEVPTAILSRLRARLAEAQEPDAEYCAMAKVAIATGFP